MHTKHFTIFLTLLLLLAAFTGCGNGDAPADDSAAANTSAAVQEPVDAVESGDGEETAVSEPASNEETTSETSTSVEQPTAVPPDALYVDPEETLDSYRMITDIHTVSGDSLMFMGNDMHIEMAFVRNPPAQHTITSGMMEDMVIENIVIGSQSWINMGDGNWIETSNTPGNQGTDSNQGFTTDLEDMMEEIQNSMVAKGNEAINGINCQKYEVDADFSFAMPLPEDAADDEMAAQFFPSEIVGHITGNIWIAADSGLPPVALRSETTQEMTMKYEGKPDEVMVYEETRELSDINQPITIEPPAGAVVMPSAPVDSTASDTTTGATGPDIEVVSLDTLDSYRLEWGVLMQASADNSAIPLGNRIEWVREPYAVHVEMGMGNQMMTEYIIVDDRAWASLGSAWFESTTEEATDAYAGIAENLDLSDDAVFVDEETVDGIHCLHYVYDFQEMIHQEWWVADQDGVPPVVIKTLFRMNSGSMNTETHGRVYDINEPIVIEPPN